MWWRAVALGGAGHYAAARIALRRLRAGTSEPVLLSLAASTEGSLRRQLGWHARAAHDDGYAAALVLPRLAGVDASGYRHPERIDPNAGGYPLSGRFDNAAVVVGADSPSGTGGTDAAGVAGGADAAGVDAVAGYYRFPDLVDAAADALTGLAADALGTGRLALATRLLDRCGALLDAERRGGAGGGRAAPPRAGARGGGAPPPPRARPHGRWSIAPVRWSGCTGSVPKPRWPAAGPMRPWPRRSSRCPGPSVVPRFATG